MQYGILFKPSKMTIHTCSYQGCKKQFDQKTKFVDYLNRYTGMKTYDCGNCDKAFFIWYLRNQHATVCQGEVSPEQYTFYISSVILILSISGSHTHASVERHIHTRVH